MQLGLVVEVVVVEDEAAARERRVLPRAAVERTVDFIVVVVVGEGKEVRDFMRRRV